MAYSRWSWEAWSPRRGPGRGSRNSWPWSLGDIAWPTYKPKQIKFNNWGYLNRLYWKLLHKSSESILIDPVEFQIALWVIARNPLVTFPKIVTNILEVIGWVLPTINWMWFEKFANTYWSLYYSLDWKYVQINGKWRLWLKRFIQEKAKENWLIWNGRMWEVINDSRDWV